MPPLISPADYIFFSFQIAFGLAGIVCFFTWGFLSIVGWADFVRWITGSKYPLPFSPKEEVRKKWIFIDTWRSKLKLWILTLVGAFAFIFISIMIGMLRWPEMIKN